MAKYEIMAILAPGEDVSTVSKVASDVFGQESLKSVEKLERTELAYPINKSKTAVYVLMVLEADEQKISEFVRLTNISKTIWRVLVINLDSEKGLNRKTTVKKIKPRPAFVKKTFNSTGRRFPNQDGTRAPFQRNTEGFKKPESKSTN
ncbi:30S ribosomal protein S6 [Mycoplasma iguanae]|uniref:Small ribosomal subunit protein bS6 n=1 Tax=Mycoplasma iguanae TaxID=292461 RepID=A0ABY5RAV9_9MOLU|nr:30S ribosomal protein S6 [Mycoplasma iguanae]UVD81750.1 30S ribosomal protein S6 [Mycoplasma iguanae]